MFQTSANEWFQYIRCHQPVKKKTEKFSANTKAVSQIVEGHANKFVGVLTLNTSIFACKI